MAGGDKRHVFFFDVRNTLGVVDRKGHLVRFRQYTDQLLKALKALSGVRLAVITNVLPGVDAARMLANAGLDGYFENIISTQDPEILAVHAEKPQRAMYELAARAMGVDVGNCTYVSENLLEVRGGIGAGMQSVVKRFPPGGDYMRANLPRGTVSSTSSGRLSEALLEGQHLEGRRIVVAAVEIVKRLREGGDSSAPKGAAPGAARRVLCRVLP